MRPQIITYGKMQPACALTRRNGMRNRWKSVLTAPASVVTVSALVAGVTGCVSSTPQVSMAGPPTVVCGTELSDSAAAPVVFNATRHLPTIKYLTVGGVLMFRVASGCSKGSHVTWVPSSAAHLIKAAYASDGQMAAVVLRPNEPRAAFRLTGTQNGTVVASATIQLAS
jgi:hypothetical protein